MAGDLPLSHGRRRAQEPASPRALRAASLGGWGDRRCERGGPKRVPPTQGWQKQGPARLPTSAPTPTRRGGGRSRPDARRVQTTAESRCRASPGGRGPLTHTTAKRRREGRGGGIVRPRHARAGRPSSPPLFGRRERSEVPPTPRTRGRRASGRTPSSRGEGGSPRPRPSSPPAAEEGEAPPRRGRALHIRAPQLLATPTRGLVVTPQQQPPPTTPTATTSTMTTTTTTTTTTTPTTATLPQKKDNEKSNNDNNHNGSKRNNGDDNNMVTTATANTAPWQRTHQDCDVSAAVQMKNDVGRQWPLASPRGANAGWD